MPPPFAAGDVVLARGRRWVVEEATAFADCVLFQLAGLAGPGFLDRPRVRLLHPFDRLAVPRATRRLRVVPPTPWIRNLQSAVANLSTWEQLRSARSASIDILPFQLEPALALVRGRASRFLLADEVGLGKTIQAGLMLSELQQRGSCERALILTPAGLRQQWADELQQRFGVRAVVFDAPALRGLVATLPHGVNPWEVEPIVIASTDFIKQPEVLQATTSILWDMLIIDEAHQVAAAPLRAAAVRLLAERARNIALLTATPHAGDEAAYRALCGLGQISRDDRILLFRRSREKAGLKRTRRVHLLPVRLTRDELHMHRLLAAYTSRLWQLARQQHNTELQLVAMGLSKRAFSSASSLASSIERRLASVSGQLPSQMQSAFAFDDDEPGDEEPMLTAPAFERPDEEEAALRHILAAAELAGRDERKVYALCRLLGRVREPAIVFTEYRDSLSRLGLAVAGLRRTVLLHGGLTLSERRAAVEAFTTGRADLLLATDAGSEGLNLQSRCRLIVNLELPWNPIRLEQRIGRVDRLGQSRTVHAIHLFAAETAESTVLANLVRRLHRIRASEIEIATCIINGAEARLAEPEHAAEASCTETVDLAPEAESEAVRLRGLKTSMAGPRPTLDEQLAAVTVVSSSGTGTANPSIVWFARSRIVSGTGRLIEELLIPVAIRLKSGVITHRRLARAHERLVEQFGPAVAAMVRKHTEQRAAAISEDIKTSVARAIIREQHLARVVRVGTGSLIQAGLFDTRSLKHRDEVLSLRDTLLTNIDARVATLESACIASSAAEPELKFLLIRC